MFDYEIMRLTRSDHVAVVSLCSEGRWRCTDVDCNADILCPGELVHRADISDCNSTCDGLNDGDCNPEAPLRSGCACPNELVLHPQVSQLRRILPFLHP